MMSSAGVWDSAMAGAPRASYPAVARDLPGAPARKRSGRWWWSGAAATHVPRSEPPEQASEKPGGGHDTARSEQDRADPGGGSMGSGGMPRYARVLSERQVTVW